VADTHPHANPARPGVTRFGAFVVLTVCERERNEVRGIARKRFNARSTEY